MKNMNHRDTETQRHRGTEAQRHRGTEAQRHRGTEEKRKDTRGFSVSLCLCGERV